MPADVGQINKQLHFTDSCVYQVSEGPAVQHQQLNFNTNKLRSEQLSLSFHRYEITSHLECSRQRTQLYFLIRTRC